MDWSRIKTIFIISFLLLDIYLVFQFTNTQSESNYEAIEEASIEEMLENNEIKLTYSQPAQEIKKDRYISVKPKVFSEDEVLPNNVQGISNSEDGSLMIGQLEEPIKLSEKFNPDEFAAIIAGIVPEGEKYRFWEKDDSNGTITFYQVYDGKMMYHNLNGKLTFYINEKNEVEIYEQTFLEEIEEMSSEEEILAPLGAIEILYKKGYLEPKSEITKVELGYSTLIQLAASQVLAPTWRIVVNGEENLFVHAFEGQVIEFNRDKNNLTE